MVDLQVRFEGSITKQDIINIADYERMMLPLCFEEDTLAIDKCNNEEDYLKFYELPLTYLQTTYGIEYAMKSLVKRLFNKGYLYAEIVLAPYLHTKKHLTQERVIKAALHGLYKGLEVCPGFDVNLILMCLKEADAKANKITAELAIDYARDNKIRGLSIGGYEPNKKAEDFLEIFTMANENHLPVEYHYSHSQGREDVLKAIELGAKRIVNPINLSLDSELIFKMSRQNVTCILLPSEAIDKRLMESFEVFPIRNYTSQGINATLSSGNFTISKTDISREYIYMINHLDFRKEEVYRYLSNALAGSFLTVKEKGQLIPKLIAAFPTYFETLI